jgi:hypothetical protein
MAPTFGGNDVTFAYQRVRSFSYHRLKAESKAYNFLSNLFFNSSEKYPDFVVKSQKILEKKSNFNSVRSDYSFETAHKNKVHPGQ